MKNRIVKAMLCMMAVMTVTTSYGGLVTFAAEANDAIVTDVGDYMINNGTIDFGQGNASITIQGNQGQSMVGKRFEVFRLFDAENSTHGESINYTFNAKYANPIKSVVAKALNKRDGVNISANDVTEYMVIDYIQTLNNNKVEGTQTNQNLEGRYSAFRYFVEDVRTAIKDSGIVGDLVYVNGTKADNSISMNGLAYGYYIVDEISQHDENDEQWYASSLCMVNTANPVATINIKSDYPHVIKKIQEDDHKDAVANDGWNDVADYEIGQTVPYKYESTISDMNGYQSYYYAWHDQMDKQLTFHSDKKEISIVIKSADGKYYTVKDSEYNVITSGDKLDADDTFMIEITDIKKIIDRQFNKVDNLGHNDYSGLTVTLNYNATLNEKAADQTGRPGFENDVRLEFSNDADVNGSGDTGYTPWDTVVCFTFKINGLKVNDHDFKLEGAKFRLYSDADCKNEVFVKAKVDSASANLLKGITGQTGTTDNVTSPDADDTVGNNGYIVINRDTIGGKDHEGGTAPAEAIEMMSDKDGNFTIYGLDQGTYYLKETDAPDGYRPLKDAIVINVKPTYTSDRNDYVAGEGATEATLQKLEATAHIKEFYDGQYKEGDAQLNTNVEAGSADIKVINEVGSKLPITGSSAMLIMLGAGVALMGGAMVAGKKKKQTNIEK